MQLSILTRKREVFLCAVTICSFILLWQMGFVSKVFRVDTRVESHSPQVEIEIEDEDPNPKIIPKVFDLQAADQTDKDLLYYVRSHFIFLPSVLEYSFGKDKPLGYLDPEVDNVVYPLFKNKTGGFFVEVGAYDGLSSHTLILERDYKFNGLLIECNPHLIPVLKSVNRKAYISDVCLSTTNHPVKSRLTSMDQYLASSSMGSGNLYPNYKSNFTTFEVQTIPLYSIIASIDVTVVDLIILDVQSLELDVLKHFPFELILVKVWVVETYFYNADQKSWLLNLLASKGYPESRVVKLTNDFVFIHESMV